MDNPSLNLGLVDVNGGDQPLAKINILKATIAFHEFVAISAQLVLIGLKGGDTQWITVIFVNPNPSSNDWIGVFSPAKFDPLTLSTKRTSRSNRATNLSSRTMYDDAFGGGGPTLSPRPEDYTEIFGGFHVSRGSSIPVLDLPLMNDSNEVMFDVRNPRFNYANVFDGFDDLDFPASYEDLIRQANTIPGLLDDAFKELDQRNGSAKVYGKHIFNLVLVVGFGRSAACMEDTTPVSCLLGNLNPSLHVAIPSLDQSSRKLLFGS
ncbi:hypothetical protein F3Y22_tig00111390pilonHSYRG00018 [Hibiscus syriacus]|uniref:Purple acid phosphatase Fn3-like domain-containing protein n=1 Tax=Hibiscus syriacus TaxID=106335 RepID=A0A6A2YM55_HIBSY|nr:hypothetical protein F3Y22_tig00111390pilonHSYRG00018 [Hibiscus syriacus]